MNIVAKKKDITNIAGKKIWKKPVIVTITQKELAIYIKAAADSSGGCLGVGR